MNTIKRIKDNDELIFEIINNILLFIVLVVVLYPLIFVVSASFSNVMDVIQGKVLLFPVNLNLKAYERVYENKDIWTGYRNTIFYTVIGTIINLAMTVAAAYPLSRRDFVGRNLLMAIFTFTMFFHGGLIPSYLVNKSLGLVNNFWVMILPTAVAMYNIIITRTFFINSIPYEIHEAAVIDGCSNFGVLFNIILPLSTPILAVMALFYGVGHWNSFFTALIYIKNKELFPLQLILREILIMSRMQDMLLDDETALEQQMMSEGIKYAAIVVASLPVLMLYPLIQRYFVKGVMIGAIKG